MTDEDRLDAAIAEWLERKEDQPELLPGEFARQLDEPLRAQFLAELESLADLDQMATGAAPRDLPLRYGGFRVLGEIGRGAMGAVYAAEEVATGKRVALKVLHAHVASEPDSASRFRREALTAQSLDHPAIVRVFGSGEEGGSAWLAMDLVEGHSLQRLLVATADPRDVDHDRARRLFDPPEQLAEQLAAMADALEHAHRRDVIHRDVKPANLMIRNDGGVVVLDFGLATARDSAAPTLTRAGDFLGTPLYMAPEQAVGAENGTARSDVYALGAVLYECLCGRPPVQPGPLAKVIDSILNSDPVDPRKLRPGVPDGLTRIALQCLEKDPARRYPTAAALAADLRRYAAGESVHARTAGLLQRSLRQVRRRPVVTALGVAAVLLAGTLVGTAIYGGQQAAHARALTRSADLRKVPELLGGAPERITVFGGASLRFYATVGLGIELPAGNGARSPRAARALELAEALAAEHPHDDQVLRTLAMALLDVGDDPARTGAVIEALLALPAATPGDRAMAAVFEQRRGDDDKSERLLAALPDRDQADVAFWLGLWHQHRQDYFAAITAFDRALAKRDLDEERRYFALLHRGWCRTCPDVLHLQDAENDLLQAAALRPAYGTARLLWAALRCLDPADDLSRPVAAVGEVLQGAESWVTVLTARVLLALAQGGTYQAGPVDFGSEFSPVARMPIAPARAVALAGLALQLLDGVLANEPGQFDAAFERVAALTLTSRHDDAIAACDALLTAAAGHRIALLHLQRARVHFAAGRTQQAAADVETALERDDRFLAGWRLRADIAAHVGDLPGELAALERATTLLAAEPADPSVFPDSAAMLPEMQLRRARTLLALGRAGAAEDVLLHGDFGGVIAGELGSRVQWQKVALFAATRGSSLPAAPALAALPADSPLQWLRGQRATGNQAAAAGASALLRQWIPAADLAALPLTGSATANLRVARGEVGIADAAMKLQQGDGESTTPLALLAQAEAGAELPNASAALPLGALLPHVQDLVGRPGGGERLLALADAQLQLDPANSEARLLRGVVLFVAGQPADAAAFLASSLEPYPDDLRARYLLATVALSQNDQATLRRALQRDSGRLDAATLEGARAALRTPFAATGQQLVAAAQ